MTNEEYRLHYKHRADVVFPSQRGMKRYLTSEQKIWAPFLDHVRNNLTSPIIEGHHHHRQWTAEQLATALESLIERLDNRKEFARSTGLHEGNVPLPPPSESLEGQLILGLWDSGSHKEALSAYLYFIATGREISTNVRDRIRTLIQKGKPLVEAAPIVKALPYSRVSTAKMAGAVRTAKNHVQSLADEVVTAQESNASHVLKLNAQLDEQKTQAKRVNDAILRLNRRRDRQHKLWVEATNKVVAECFEDARKKVHFFEVKSQQAEEARVAEFERLQNLFATKLQFDEPSKLWGTRETLHSKLSNRAMWRFIGTGVLTIVFGLAVPYCFGDYIANSFSQLICSTTVTEGIPTQECERAFSAKGPLTITGLLLVISVLMWVARLQYRIHLSERHLALDASEKKAFAATYLAMKEGKNVSGDREAIVLASLFRPTQDGIIRDDESGMDISALALIAKQLSRNN